MIHFNQIAIQKKSENDWRAFLNWSDSETMMQYQLRGYGSTPGEAADDAYAKYNEDRDYYVEDSWEW
jgi:hypothetical protein